MKEGKKIQCAWCEKENLPNFSKEKSDYGEILVGRCSECGNIVSSYLAEKTPVLEKVRYFQQREG